MSTRPRFKPIRAILLYHWEKYFTATSPAWWSWQAVLTYSHICIKLQADSNILVPPEAGRGNCLPYVLAPRRFPASQEDKYRDKNKKNKFRCLPILYKPQLFCSSSFAHDFLWQELLERIVKETVFLKTIKN